MRLAKSPDYKAKLEVWVRDRTALVEYTFHGLRSP